MSVLLLFRRKPPAETTKNRTGCANIFLRNMKTGERVTLEQAIALLRANW